MPSPEERDAMIAEPREQPSTRALMERFAAQVAEIQAKERAEWLKDFLSKPGEGPWRVTRVGQLPALVSHTDGRSLGWSEDEREAIAVCAALNALETLKGA